MNVKSRVRMTNVSINDVVEGTVTKVTSFGAFVDIGNAIVGLVHISEIQDGFVQDIHRQVAVGDRVLVRVLSMDDQKRRISLSMKKAAPRATGYQRVIELGGDWGHPWNDDGETNFMDLGPSPEPRPHRWEPDPDLFKRFTIPDDQD